LRLVELLEAAAHLAASAFAPASAAASAASAALRVRQRSQEGGQNPGDEYFADHAISLMYETADAERACGVLVFSVHFD
jgi:hypothetical protein